MTSDRIARDYLRRAVGRRQALEGFLAAALHADVVRESQETIELILKGVLRFVGVDPPKRHDVHDLIMGVRDRLPAEWQAAIEEHRAGLDRLVQERGRAFYGDEASDAPASDLFTEGDARQALLVVDRFLEMYGRLLGPEMQPDPQGGPDG